MLFLHHEDAPKRHHLSDLERMGPWPGSPVASRAEAREAQQEASALSEQLLGLVPGGLLPGGAEGILEELSEAMGPLEGQEMRQIAQLAAPKLSEPRRWAWELQLCVLEAIKARKGCGEMEAPFKMV